VQREGTFVWCVYPCHMPGMAYVGMVVCVYCTCYEGAEISTLNESKKMVSE
jgi:hypothetical protein